MKSLYFIAGNMNMSIPFTELSDGAITLRPYTKKDAGVLFEAVRESLRELSAWLPFAHERYDISESRDWIKQCPKDWKDGYAFNFAITNGADGAFLGGCGLNEINGRDRRCNLGYWVRTTATGRGIAPAATRLLARWGFETLKLRRIEIVVNTANARSLRVAEKSGARREGILRNRFFGNKQSPDAVLFSLIPGEV